MNRILSIVAAFVLVAGLALVSRPARAAGSCGGYLASNTCVLASNLTDTGSGLTLYGPVVRTPTQYGAEGTTFGIYGTSTIVVTSEYEMLTSSGGSVTMVNTPTISTLTVAGANIPAGQVLVLGSSVAAYGFTFQANGTLAGSLIYLGSASRTVNNKNTLSLIFGPDGFWHETSFVTGQ